MHARFRRWRIADVWERLFKAFSADPDFEHVLVDATICKTRADATSQKGGLEAAGIGCSKGSLTTKIHAALDALGLPIRTIITPGQWGDSPQERGLIEGLTKAQNLIMDAACDADHLRRFIAKDLVALAHIKRNPTRREGRLIDWDLYKERHLVACFFNRIKGFRRIALRCEKTVSSFKACVDLACAMAWIDQMQTPPKAARPASAVADRPSVRRPRG